MRVLTLKKEKIVERREGVCVLITAGPIMNLCAGGKGESEGHVL